MKASWRLFPGGALYWGGSLNKEASWRPLYGGAQGGGSLNKEASWSQLYGGAQGACTREPLLAENRNYTRSRKVNFHW